MVEFSTKILIFSFLNACSFYPNMFLEVDRYHSETLGPFERRFTGSFRPCIA